MKFIGVSLGEQVADSTCVADYYIVPFETYENHVYAFKSLSGFWTQ